MYAPSVETNPHLGIPRPSSVQSHGFAAQNPCPTSGLPAHIKLWTAGSQKSITCNWLRCLWTLSDRLWIIHVESKSYKWIRSWQILNNGVVFNLFHSLFGLQDLSQLCPSRKEPTTHLVQHEESHIGHGDHPTVNEICEASLCFSPRSWLFPNFDQILHHEGQL